MIAKIQARHDVMKGRREIVECDYTDANEDRAWLLSDRKALDIAYQTVVTGWEQDRQKITRLETEIRLLREVQLADDLYIAAMIANDNESRLVFADGYVMARAALLGFDKENGTTPKV